MRTELSSFSNPAQAEQRASLTIQRVSNSDSLSRAN
jgi:hypothetical protein